jgi:hypothetical protein
MIDYPQPRLAASAPFLLGCFIIINVILLLSPDFYPPLTFMTQFVDPLPSSGQRLALPAGPTNEYGA